MSLRRRSPCLILEFVAMGREGSPSVVGEDDDFPDLARGRGPDDRLEKPSNEGGFG
jgi:hypothetical protein